ncbi:MAG: hypothetical protein IPL98_07540 [Saprospiraceae bacterium]|jgi:hypothetical protein|nr:hypothetical protein [Saprospiraceae bacterium]
MQNQRQEDIKNFPILKTSIILTLILASLWLINDFWASFLSILITMISFFILIISYIVEWIEPSKIPRWYFQLLIVFLLIPLILGLVFGSIYGFKFDWMKL